MLGKKYKELNKRYYDLEEDYAVLKYKVDTLSERVEQLEFINEQKTEQKHNPQEDNPYYNPHTKMYDFKYYKDRMKGERKE